jgi:hypothetical protein
VTISLARQVARIQLTILGERNRLDEVQARGRWPETDITMKRLEIVEHEAVLATLRWLLENEDAIRAATVAESQT